MTAPQSEFRAEIIEMARRARDASERVAELSTQAKNDWLLRCAGEELLR